MKFLFCIYDETNYIKSSEPTHVHWNSDLETINRPIMKNVGENVQRNTGDLKNSKHSLKYNFIFKKDANQQKEQMFVTYV